MYGNMQGLSNNKNKIVCWTPKLMWLLLKKRWVFPDKWRTYLSFLHQVSVGLVWLRQSKNQCVCVCEMQDNKLCLYWGKSWILQRKWHQPLQYGCNPNSWLCQRVLGRNCSPSPFNTVISNCWSME